MDGMEECVHSIGACPWGTHAPMESRERDGGVLKVGTAHASRLAVQHCPKSHLHVPPGCPVHPDRTMAATGRAATIKRRLQWAGTEYTDKGKSWSLHNRVWSVVFGLHDLPPSLLPPLLLRKIAV
jgi:hypothetical protein